MKIKNKLLSIAVIFSLGIPIVSNAYSDFNPPSVQTSFIDNATNILEKRLKTTDYPTLRKLYAQLFYTPVWIGKNGLTRFGKELFNHILSDSTIPPVLHLKDDVKSLENEVDSLYQNDAPLSKKIDEELKISRLYLNYMQYLIYGGINWKAFDAKRAELTKKYKIKVGWEYYRPVVNPVSLLVSATMKGDLNYAFKNAEPKRFKYQKLKSFLIRDLKIAKEGGWGRVPKYKRIKPGTENPAIVAIRKHLKLTGDAKECYTPDNPQLYDECLANAVTRYKLRHGLKGSPVLDRATRYWLNRSIWSDIATIRLNLDRIKWIWHKEAPIRIELNIPAFRLYFYQGNRLIDTMRVITGRPNHPTPIFHNTMRYIVVNPYWKIPESIVKSEMLKHLIKDPYYYEKRGKVLHRTWDENSPRVDPGTIDWSQYRAKDKHIPYYFMQVPGSRNALGKIKFLFPNKYSVYIHDTPSKRLFFRNVRAYSHGCMRIQKPRELLKVLALYNDNIDVDYIMDLLGTKIKKTIGLKQKVPVDIVYLTSYVDDYGNLNFRKDIYHYDKYQMDYYAYNPKHKEWNPSEEK